MSEYLLPRVIIEVRFQGMCRLPYPDHPRGCPNFDNKLGCPPRQPLFDAVIDLSRPVFAIVTEFDLAGQITKMKRAHPEWSERQLACCLYWQPAARKNLKLATWNFLARYPNYFVDTCPEARGVNVTETLSQVGIQLEWPPRSIVRQVALAGRPIREERELERNRRVSFPQGTSKR